MAIGATLMIVGSRQAVMRGEMVATCGMSGNAVDPSGNQPQSQHARKSDLEQNQNQYSGYAPALLHARNTPVIKFP
jgi:hypothetical protein